MYNGHNKQKAELDIVGNNTDVDPFGANAAAALAYKKMERLVTATYMVTNYVPKSENLRQRVRDIASNLLTDTITLRSGFTSLGIDALSNIIAQVRTTLSMLDALYASGLISEMNLKVLKSAYTDFTQSLSAMAQGSASDGVELTSEYFSQAQATQKTSKQGLDVKSNRSGEIALLRKKEVVPINKHSVDKPKARSNKGTERVQTIIDFITKRGSASTGDVAQLITDCSSKTLQRDLNKLVQDGVLIKNGEKRWTRYSIA